MFSSSSIGKKLFYAFFALTSISAIIGFLSFMNIRQNNVVFNDIILHSTPRIQALLEMKNISNEIGHNANEIGHNLQLTQTTSSTSVISSQTEAMFAADSKSLVLADLERLLHWIDEYRDAVGSSEDSKRTTFLTSVNQRKSAIIAATLDYVDATERNADATSITSKETHLTTEIAALKRLIESSLAEETEALRNQKRSADSAMKNTIITTAVMSTLSVCLALFAWIFLVRIIVRPLRSLRDATHKVAGGNTENIIAVTSKDEIGDLAKAFNNMIERLHETHGVLVASNDELENVKKEVEKKLAETERMNQHMINRELKMIELKEEIAALKSRQS